MAIIELLGNITAGRWRLHAKRIYTYISAHPHWVGYTFTELKKTTFCCFTKHLNLIMCSKKKINNGGGGEKHGLVLFLFASEANLAVPNTRCCCQAVTRFYPAEKSIQLTAAGKKKTLRQRNKVIKDNTRLCVEKLKPSEEHNLGGFHVISTDTALLEEHCSSDLFKAKHLEKKRFTQGLIFHLNVKQDISPVLHRPSLLLITITLVEPITMSSFLWAAIDAIICTEKSRWWPSGGRQKFHQAWLPQQLQKFQTHNLH